MAKQEALQGVELSFSQLTPTLDVQPHHYIRGRVLSARRFNATTQLTSFTLTPLTPPNNGIKSALKVQLQGSWAEAASNELDTGHRVVIMLAHNPKIIQPAVKSEEGAPPATKVLKMEFSTAFEGYCEVENGVDDARVDDSAGNEQTKLVHFHYSSKSPQVVEGPKPPAQGSSTGASAARKRTAESPAEGQEAKKPAYEEKKPKNVAPQAWGLIVQYGTAQIEYTALARFNQAQDHCNMNIIGSAFISALPKQSTKGERDWMVMIQLCDPTQHHSFAQIVVFAKKKEDLPSFEDGDVVFCRNLRWSSMHGNFVAYKHEASFAPLSKALLLDPTSNIVRALFKPVVGQTQYLTFAAEIQYARDLAKEIKRLGGGDEDDRMNENPKDIVADRHKEWNERPAGRALQEVREMSEGVFCDAVVEVLHIHTNGRDPLRLYPTQAISVFATDYTTNDSLFHYDAPAFGVCPVGQKTLQISIFGNQAEPLYDIQSDLQAGERAYAHFRNLCIKTNSHGFMEATMVEDNVFKNKRDVKPISVVNAVPDLWEEQVQAIWARDDEIIIDDDAQDGPLNYVVCDLVNEEVYPVAGLASSGIVGEFHLKAQVVDYFPAKMEEWLIAYCDGCGDRIPFGSNSCLNHPKSSLSLRLHFFLGLNDNSQENGRPSSLRIMIDEGARPLLFPDLKLTLNMRAGEEEALNLLREQVGPLLGNLERVKKDKKTQVEETDFGPLFDLSVEMVECEGGVGGPTTKGVMGRGMVIKKP